MWWGRFSVAFFGSIGLATGCGGELCDTAALQAALDAAEPGGVVQAGECTIEGSVTVPEGVTLRGRGTGRSILATSEGGTAVVLREGAALEALEVHVERGRAVEVDGVASARIRDVALRGPVDEASASTLPPTPSAMDTATHGLVVIESGSSDAPIELANVRASGFARFGVLLLDSHVRWELGSASQNLGTGLMASGGSVGLRGVEICSTWRGTSAFGYGAVFRGGAVIESDDLVLCDNEAAGALHDASPAEHRALDATGNAAAGVWVQRNESFTLRSATITDNALAGLVLVETDAATVHETEIADTRAVLTIVPDVGEVRAGDGLHAVLADASELSLQDLSLTGNERVGLLLQLGDGVVPAGALSGVVVEAEGEALGAVAQTESSVLDPAEWEAGIDRRGVAATNDAAEVDRLSVLGAVAPMFLPPPEP